MTFELKWYIPLYVLQNKIYFKINDQLSFFQLHYIVRTAYILVWLSRAWIRLRGWAVRLVKLCIWANVMSQCFRIYRSLHQLWTAIDMKCAFIILQCTVTSETLLVKEIRLGPIRFLLIFRCLGNWWLHLFPLPANYDSPPMPRYSPWTMHMQSRHFMACMEMLPCLWYFWAGFVISDFDLVGISDLSTWFSFDVSWNLASYQEFLLGCVRLREVTSCGNISFQISASVPSL